MSGKRITKPGRPRLRRPRKRAEQWLILEPARLAALGGAVCGLLVLLVNLLRQVAGIPVSPGNVLVAAALTFVVSYTLIGVFVWYLLWVAEKEWPDLEPEARTIHLEGRRDRAAAVETAPENAMPDDADNEGNPQT
jgi:hypothetical protein